MNGLFEIRLGISEAYGRAIVNGLFRPRVLFYKKERDSPVRFDTGQSTSTVNCNVR